MDQSLLPFVGFVTALVLFTRLVKKTEEERVKQCAASSSKFTVKLPQPSPPLTSAPSKSKQADTIDKGRVIENAKITEIRLHDIKTLRDFFPSANIPKYTFLYIYIYIFHFNSPLRDIKYSESRRNAAESCSGTKIRSVTIK
jgi:hypothetical protein